MNIQEMRLTKDYGEAVEKIKAYPIWFEFTLNYADIPKAKGNALKVITGDCIKMGILESISFGLDLCGNCTEETYRRIEPAE